MRAMRPEHHSQHRHRDRKAGDDILEHLVRPEIGVALGDRLGRRDPVAAEQVDVPDDQQHEQARQHAGVQCEEARQRVVPVLGSADHELLQLRPDERHEVDQVSGDLGGPKPFLIPRQQVAGQRQGQHEQQQQDAEPVVHLARRLVRAVHDDLHQVQQQ